MTLLQTKFDPEIDETIDTLMGQVADEAFEGWQEYWQEQKDFEYRLKMVLQDWREHCIFRSERQSK